MMNYFHFFLIFYEIWALYIRVIRDIQYAKIVKNL